MRRSAAGLAFVAPALAFLVLVMLVPLALSVKDAFYENNLTTISPHYVGLHNFRIFLTNTSLRNSIPTTIVFVVFATVGALLAGLAWAMVLEHIRRGRAILRAATLIPWVLPSVVTAFLWAWIFNGQFGVLNGIAHGLGIIHTNIAWLADPLAAKAAVVVARIWQSAPWFVLMFLAGLQSAPTELVEAVRVDGGGNWSVFRHVIVPHLRFTIIIALMLGAMGNLQLFDLVYAMTGGGPAGATSMMSLAVYQQAFQIFDNGVAAAIGVVWILTLVIPAAVYVRATMPTRAERSF